MEFGEKKFINPTGWNFGIQYRILMGVLTLGVLLFDVANGQIGIRGIIILVFGILVLFTRSKLEIDFEGKKYRESRYLFGIFIYGAWAPFPEFEYVSVFNARISNTFSSRANQSTITVEELQVNLVYNKNRRITVCVLPDKEKAFAASIYFSQKLGGIRRLNATVKPFEWLD